MQYVALGVRNLVIDPRNITELHYVRTISIFRDTNNQYK
jgi:hypothetical protein